MIISLAFGLKLLILDASCISFLHSHGNDEDFGIFPMKVNPYEGFDFQFDTLKSLIDMGYAIQFVPTLRETFCFVSALLSLNNGKIFFRMRRTDIIMNYIETIKAVA